MRRVAVIAAALGFGIAVYLGTHLRPSVPTRSADTKSLTTAPAVVLTDLSGNQIHPSAYAGKVVLINFWAAWCTPCATEVPQLIALQDKYGPHGFQVIGISMEDRDSELRDFYRNRHMNYPVVAGNSKLAEAYGGILGLPTSLLVDRDGRIRAKYAGLLDVPKLERDIVALLRTNQ